MPRVVRKAPDTLEARHLDEIARAFNQLEARLEKMRPELQSAVIAAVHSGLSKSEAARRAGYTREYVSKLVSDADKAAKGA